MWQALDENLNLVVIGSNDGKLQLYNSNGEKRPRELKAKSNCEINAVIVTYDNRYIVAACEDRKILL